MKFTGEQQVVADASSVWDGLMNPLVLKAAIPGCEQVDRTDEGYSIVLTAAIGPIKAKFNGNLQLSDVDAPRGCTMKFTGSSGSAGNAKGTARVTLADVDCGTLIRYDANVQTAGKVAQLGGRMVELVAARMIAQFFARLKEVLEPAPARSAEGAPELAAPTSRARTNWKRAALWWARLLRPRLAKDADVEDVLRVDQQRCDALERGAADILELLFADDLHFTHTSGRGEGKGELISALRGGTVRYTRVATSEVVGMAASDAVMLRGVQRTTLVRDEKELVLRAFFKSVWLRRAGRWQLVSWISTPLASDTVPAPSASH